MEDVLRALAGNVALVAELACVVMVAVGGVVTLVRLPVALARGQAHDQAARRRIYVGFAGWIILALEFALAADIVRTAIAPTWDQIGQLAAIAAIRTVLNHFLEKDVEAREPSAQPLRD